MLLVPKEKRAACPLPLGGKLNRQASGRWSQGGHFLKDRFDAIIFPCSGFLKVATGFIFESVTPHSVHKKASTNCHEENCARVQGREIVRLLAPASSEVN